jgi:hypothetical protein
MPLIDLDVPPSEGRMPRDVQKFLHEAERRIRKFQRDAHLPAFVPSDFGCVWNVLRAFAAADLAPGQLFCEWGSGFGVIACLAAMLDFDAFGIEVEGELVDEARRLADDFGLPVEFAHGSFLPNGTRADGEYAWLSTDAADAHEELGLDAEDFGVIFAYPWPDEEGLTERIFEQHAAAGAVLVTYHGGDDFRLRRLVADRRSARRARRSSIGR